MKHRLIPDHNSSYRSRQSKEVLFSLTSRVEKWQSLLKVHYVDEVYVSRLQV